MIDIEEIESMEHWTNDYKARMFWDLIAEVKRLREAMKTMLDVMNNASPGEDIEYWLGTWKHWLKEMVE